MKKKNGIWIILIALGVAVSWGIGWLILGFQVKQSDDISYYRALSGEQPGKAALQILGSDYVECPYDLPQLGELEPYRQVRFNHMAKRAGIFTWHSYVLVVSFDQGHYDAQKAALVEKYDFCPLEPDEIMAGGYGCRLDGFEIRAVEGGEYPHQMLFIGCNDTSREIAIVFYYDQDLDYVDNLGQFLTEETGWTNVI